MKLEKTSRLILFVFLVVFFVTNALLLKTSDNRTYEFKSKYGTSIRAVTVILCSFWLRSQRCLGVSKSRLSSSEPLNLE